MNGGTVMNRLGSRRRAMVAEQLLPRGITDNRVLEAMKSVPREEFIPPPWRSHAYDDGPVPIGRGQTISQPYIVAAMIEMLRPQPRDRVLEVGAGSGYAAAVLGQVVAVVHAIERHGALVEEARERIARLGYDNVTVREGNGTVGVPEEAPFDGIIVAAAGPRIPGALRRQLAIGGRLVMPVGRSTEAQHLVRVIRRGKDAFEEQPLVPVRFVPLVGREGWPEEGGARQEPHP